MLAGLLIPRTAHQRSRQRVRAPPHEPADELDGLPPQGSPACWETKCQQHGISTEPYRPDDHVVRDRRPGIDATARFVPPHFDAVFLT